MRYVLTFIIEPVVRDQIIISFDLKISPRGLFEGGYYQNFVPLTAGIIRVQVLFEGGSYLRKYGNQKICIITLQKDSQKVNYPFFNF